MAPTERVHLPLRWEFVPLKQGGDGAVHWKWRAHRHTGELAMESKTAFDALTECVQNAMEHGYGG
jgi:hypothetical protein